ncbi:hypothetical protein PRUPE_3G214300 [Prunus persica]|uniref:Uncharacterized protein n=1 Tax=Prunus persica TaxID=3760 RepID=A0A251Q3P0_PRUPE|nr:hypothetical protein PRUPE_3G214300 [Prunus persica]
MEQRRTASEGHIRGIGVRMDNSSARKKEKRKKKKVMDTLDRLTDQRLMAPEEQLRGIGARMNSSSVRKKEKRERRRRKKKCHEHLGSVEKPKAHGSRMTTKGYWSPHGQVKCKRKKKKKRS